MRIGILTLPFNNNYGGYLQAYALMTVLKLDGHAVELVYRQHNKKRIPMVYYAKWILKKIMGRDCGPFYPSIINCLRYKGKYLMPFVDKFIVPRTGPLYSSQDLQNAIAKGNYDTVICGSDQLWRPEYVPNIEDFFLSFVKGDRPKLISYAASFGTDEPIYTEEQRKKCGDAIANFAAVSLRELSGIDVIKRFSWMTKEEPQVVLDPTMLLTKEHYESLLPVKTSPSKGKVFCYVLDQSKEAQILVNQICQTSCCSPYHIIDSKKWKRQDYQMPSIEDWLSGIRDAEYVVTDSYHGTIFSIIFNKPFVVYINKKRGSDRFNTLLQLFNLKEISANNYSDNRFVDWNSINKKIEWLRKKSLIYLKNNL